MFLSEWPLIGSGLVCRVLLFRSNSGLNGIGSFGEQGRIVIAWSGESRVPVIERVTGAGGSLEAEIALQHFKAHRIQRKRDVVSIVDGDDPFRRRCECLIRCVD